MYFVADPYTRTTKVKTKLQSTLEAVWYAAGPAQYLMYGVWTIVVSGMYHLEGDYQLLSTLCKFIGFFIIVGTIWGTLEHKKKLILASVMNAVMVGSVYTTHAMMFEDPDVLRAATQAQYMTLVVLVFWGFYLANLAARQQLEFARNAIHE